MTPTLASQRGYTLKELIIAVAIMAILAAIATRSFRSAALKSNRENGIACLVEVQKRMEDYYSRNGGTAASGGGYPTALSQIGYGAGSCPAAEGKNTQYTVALTIPNTAISGCTLCYKLRATGVGPQAKDGALQLSVDPRGGGNAAPGDIYHKQHVTPAGTVLEGWVFQPGR